MFLRLEAASAEERITEWQNRNDAIQKGLDQADRRLEETKNPETPEELDYRLATIRVRDLFAGSHLMLRHILLITIQP